MEISITVPIIVDTKLQATDCQWNHDGTVLAVCGMRTYGTEKDSNIVIFYSVFGDVRLLIDPSIMITFIQVISVRQHLRTLKIPGHEITALAWEGRSLRIALAVDSFIYFANIRPDYMWCYFGKTVCYLNADTSKTGSYVVTFWDTVSNQCNNKHIDEPISMAASSDHCVIAVECPHISSKDPNVVIENNKMDRKYQLLICNSISTTVDCKFRIILENMLNFNQILNPNVNFNVSLIFLAKFIDLPLQYIAMNSQFVVVASKNHFLLWQYHTPKVNLIIQEKKKILI